MYIDGNDTYVYQNYFNHAVANATIQPRNKDEKSFAESVIDAENGEKAEKVTTDNQKSPQDIAESMRRLDEEIQRIKDRNARERKLLEAQRIRKKKIQKKLLERLAWKKYMARKDEMSQLNEKISLERAVGEDVYIWKTPLSKTLSLAEIREISSKV